MKTRLYHVVLPLEHEFRIARGTRSVQNSLIVELEENGCHGYGEATEHAYYGLTVDSMIESIQKCVSIIDGYRFGSPDELWSQLHCEIGHDSFALAAIDMAAHDLFGKQTQQRTFEAMGLRWGDVPRSSYTIGIDSIDRMVDKLNERPDWSVYKIKLGTDQDVEIVRQLRKHTTAVLRVDANCGWTVEQTIENSRMLKQLDVEFIEQPLPANATDQDCQRLFNESALPIIADESCLVESDVQGCCGRFHGINIKLSKCGGLTPGLRMIRQAKSLGMKTMVGCMIESSVGISAAAQLLPLLDYADLDGAELLAKDPAAGVSFKDGVALLPEEFGNGVGLHPSMISEQLIDHERSRI